MDPYRDPPPYGGEDVSYIYQNDYWYNDGTYVAKWATLGGIFFLFSALLVFGYIHAHRRMKKGLAPLAYHKWLVPRNRRMRFDPAYRNRYMPSPMNREQDGYAMSGYAPPPPVHDRTGENTPAYLPPRGASKVNPNQADYAAIPPPGAPPIRNDEAPLYPAPVAALDNRRAD